MSDEGVKLSLARLYAQIDEHTGRKPPPPKRTPAVPLAILIVFLIATVIIEVKARILVEQENEQLKAKITEQESIIIAANQRLAALDGVAQKKEKPETIKRRPVRKQKPRINGQDNTFSSGYGLKGN